MVLTFDDEKQLESLKHDHKIEFENLRHKNEMEELEKHLEIAKLTGRGLIE
jgi:hypothetical protein